MTTGYDIRTTRRRFLGGGAAAAAALALGPAFLAACGSKSGPSGGPPSNDLRISNWPYYMVEGFVAEFQNKTGIHVDYLEDFNDNEEWFAKVKEPLSRKQDIGADLVVPTSFMVGRLHSLGWLNDFNPDNVPNLKNLRADLLNSSVDPGRKFSAPYMSGLVGLAYNRATAGRDIKSVDDLWDPAFKGKVSLFADPQDGLGMIMLSQGNSPEDPTSEAVRRAVGLVNEQKAKGQVRKFTGNDYTNDLASGNVVVCQAYSGDVVQLQADNPALQFVLPEAGGTTFVDTMVIPYTSQHQDWAETWINYVYDRTNYAKLIAHTNFVPVLSNMADELNKIDPALAANPLINPPQSVLENAKSWPTLTDQQTQEYNQLYAAVTGA
ncbi:MAG: spermidine/putrescine ABC transporter substrate-binding protein [Candidatus Sericytochromatia bacterium]